MTLPSTFQNGHGPAPAPTALDGVASPQWPRNVVLPLTVAAVGPLRAEVELPLVGLVRQALALRQRDASDRAELKFTLRLLGACVVAVRGTFGVELNKDETGYRADSARRLLAGIRAKDVERLRAAIENQVQLVVRDLRRRAREAYGRLGRDAALAIIEDARTALRRRETPQWPEGTDLDAVLVALDDLPRVPPHLASEVSLDLNESLRKECSVLERKTALHLLGLPAVLEPLLDAVDELHRDVQTADERLKGWLAELPKIETSLARAVGLARRDAVVLSRHGAGRISRWLDREAGRRGVVVEALGEALLSAALGRRVPAIPEAERLFEVLARQSGASARGLLAPIVEEMLEQVVRTEGSILSLCAGKEADVIRDLAGRVAATLPLVAGSPAVAYVGLAVPVPANETETSVVEALIRAANLCGVRAQDAHSITGLDRIIFQRTTHAWALPELVAVFQNGVATSSTSRSVGAADGQPLSNAAERSPVAPGSNGSPKPVNASASPGQRSASFEA